jgi:hypothetical protein
MRTPMGYGNLNLGLMVDLVDAGFYGGVVWFEIAFWLLACGVHTVYTEVPSRKI